MKCKACGSSDITQSKGKCNECLWIYQQEQERKKEIERIQTSNSD